MIEFTTYIAYNVIFYYGDVKPQKSRYQMEHGGKGINWGGARAPSYATRVAFYADSLLS